MKIRYHLMIISFKFHDSKLNILRACYRRVSDASHQPEEFFKEIHEEFICKCMKAKVLKVKSHCHIIHHNATKDPFNIPTHAIHQYHGMHIQFHLLVHMLVEDQEASLFMWFLLKVNLFLFITTNIKS